MYILSIFRPYCGHMSLLNFLQFKNFIPFLDKKCTISGQEFKHLNLILSHEVPYQIPFQTRPIFASHSLHSLPLFFFLLRLLLLPPFFHFFFLTFSSPPLAYFSTACLQPSIFQVPLLAFPFPLSCVSIPFFFHCTRRIRKIK